MSDTAADIAYYASMYNPAYDGSSTLNGAIASTSAITLTVTSSSSFPPSGEFAIQIDSEIMWVTQGAGTTTFTVIRGFGGTTAATHSNAAAVTMPAGGGPNFLGKIDFSDVTSGDTLDYFSTSSSDTLVIIAARVRDTTGVLQIETKTLNGTTIVNGAQTCDRLLTASLAAGTTSTVLLTSATTTLTVAGNSNFPATGTFNIQMAREVMTVTAGGGTNSWTITRGVLGTTATAHNSGDNIYLLPAGDIGIFDHTKVISSHTMQTGSANASGSAAPIAKLQSGDAASVSLGQMIQITSGTGSGQLRRIIGITGYPTDVVAVSRNWSVVPDNTSVYQVYNGMMLDSAPNQVTSCHRWLWNAAADAVGGSTHTFYEKVFAVNNNTSTALTNATVQVASNTPTLPGTAALDLATATAANDTVAWANRQTAPGSGYGSFVTQPSATAYGANSGNLANGAAPNAAGAQGIVLRLTLPAATTAYKGAADLRTQGNTI